MALNDFHTQYRCLLCGCVVKVIPGHDNWGDHVYSYFKCSNESCSNKSEDSDPEFDTKIEKFFINHINDDVNKGIAINYSGVHYLTTTRLFFGTSRTEFFEDDTVCLKMDCGSFYKKVKISKIYSDELHLYQDVLKSYIVNYRNIREMWKVSK